MNPTMGLSEWVLLIVLSVLWGGSFFFIELALTDVPPLTMVFGRVGLAATALAAVAWAGGLSWPRSPSVLGSFLIMGALNNLIPFSLIVWSQTHIASGLASILNATTPIFSVLLAHVATAGERLTGHRIAGVLAGFAGVVVLIGSDAATGADGDLLPIGACLAAAVSYAVAGIFGRRFRGLPPMLTAAGQLAASTVMMAPVMLAVDRPWELAMPGWTALSALAAQALVSTAIGYTIYFRILAKAGATNLLLVTLLMPATAIWLGAAVLGEALEARHLLGMALIGLGLLAIDGRPIRVVRAWVQSHA
jgi:drug/metabolite transporter (DMT)-like permease